MAEVGNGMIGNRPWIGWALVASISANIFMGGFIAARLVSVADSEPQEFEFSLAPRTLPQELPASVREELEDGMRAYRRDMKHALRDLKRKQAEIRDLVMADEIDKAALEQAYAELRELNARLQSPIHEAVIAAMNDMGAEQRRIIFEMPQIVMPTDLDVLDQIDGNRWRFVRDGDKFEILVKSHDDGEDEMVTTVKIKTEIETEDDKPDN